MNKPAFPIHYTPRVNVNREQAAGCYGLRHAAPGYVIRHQWTVHLTRVRSREPSSICSVSHPGLENVTISFGDKFPTTEFYSPRVRQRRRKYRLVLKLRLHGLILGGGVGYLSVGLSSHLLYFQFRTDAAPIT